MFISNIKELSTQREQQSRKFVTMDNITHSILLEEVRDKIKLKTVFVIVGG